jgi:hypothetical protein
MALILSLFMSDEDAQRLIKASHVALTGCVFAFLVAMLLLS